MSERKTIKSFDYVIMIIDLADEILEFTNLVVVTLFFPFLPPWDIYDDLLYLWNKNLLSVGFEPNIFWLQLFYLAALIQQAKEIFIEQDSNPVSFVDFDVLFTVKSTVIIYVIRVLLIWFTPNHFPSNQPKPDRLYSGR